MYGLPTAGILANKLLNGDKYDPRVGPQWKQGSASLPSLYKAILEEPDQAARSPIVRRALRMSRG